MRRIAAMLVAATCAVALSQAGHADHATRLAPAPGATGPRPGSSSMLDPHADGAAIYADVCQGCHMANARGAVGAGTIPALAGNPKLASGAYVATVVTNGYGGMPPVGQSLDDRQVALIVAYVQSNFGNRFTDPVTPELVKSLRPKWTSEKWAQ